MTMTYRKLSPNGGDYVFGRNQDNFVHNELAVAQAVKTRLLLLQSEWWEDTSQGVPLFQNILGTRGNSDNIRAADSIIQSTILSTPGVVKITKYSGSYNSQNRTYAVTCTINSQYGDATITITY